jgi:hypothetical protein
VCATIGGILVDRCVWRYVPRLRIFNRLKLIEAHLESIETRIGGPVNTAYQAKIREMGGNP